MLQRIGVGEGFCRRCLGAVRFISLAVESVGPSGSCCFPGCRAQGIYTEQGSGIVEHPPRVDGPPSSDVIP